MSETRRALMRATLEKPAAEDEPLTFVASSTGLNRYGFRLRPEGWTISNFNKNPVILWGHMSFLPPIGRGQAFIDGVLKSKVTFDRGDPIGAEVDRKYREGFLSAVSVGFDFVDKKGAPITNWWRLTPEEIETESFYDLAEISAVSVPADPKALKTQSASMAAAALELIELADDPFGWLDRIEAGKPDAANAGDRGDGPGGDGKPSEEMMRAFITQMTAGGTRALEQRMERLEGRLAELKTQLQASLTRAPTGPGNHAVEGFLAAIHL
jgi:hypothetical protein